MDREVVFAQKLEAVKKRAKEQGNVISEEEIRLAFEQLSLDESQLAMIHDYLKKRGIGIGEPADWNDYLDDADKNYLELYLRELESLEAAGRGEREAVSLAAMAGDREAGKRLITLYLRDVVDMAKLYAGQGVLMEDLIGEGNLALAAGVEMLGALEHVSEVEGMLGRLMMDAMEDYIAAHTRSGHIGKQAADKVNRVADAARELSDALQRKVTVEELAAETELSAEEIREALRLSARKIKEIEDENGSR